MSFILEDGKRLEVKISSLICGCFKSEPDDFIWIFNSVMCPKHTIINGITGRYNDE